MQSPTISSALHTGPWMLLLLFLLMAMACRPIRGSPSAMPNRFIVISEQRTFFEAWRTCEYLNLQLATVQSDGDNELLRSLLNAPEYAGHTFWIAGTDIGLEGRWIWITLNTPIVFYSNWGQINPDNSNGQDCMTVGDNDSDRTLWDDRNCDEMHKIICEKVKKPAPVTEDND